MYYLIWKVWECLIERFLFLHFVLFQLKNEIITELHNYSYWYLWIIIKKANFEEQTNEIIKHKHYQMTIQSFKKYSDLTNTTQIISNSTMEE